MSIWATMSDAFKSGARGDIGGIIKGGCDDSRHRTDEKIKRQMQESTSERNPWAMRKPDKGNAPVPKTQGRWQSSSYKPCCVHNNDPKTTDADVFEHVMGREFNKAARDYYDLTDKSWTKKTDKGIDPATRFKIPEKDMKRFEYGKYKKG